jgi:hypothetical protein
VDGKQCSQLRGCLGGIEPDFSIHPVVEQMQAKAIFHGEHPAVNFIANVAR